MVGIGETGTDLFRCIDAFWKSRDCRRAIASFHVKSCKEWGSDTFFTISVCSISKVSIIPFHDRVIFFCI